MPLYEFLRLAIEKLEASQQNKCSVDLSSEVTENGKITTQKQPDTPSVCDEAALGNSVTGRIDKCGGVEYIINGISPELPSDVLDLSQKDETVPWLSYHVDGSVQDYSSSVSAKKLVARNSVMPLQNGGSCDQSAGDLDAVKLSSMKAHPLHPWMHHKEDFCILCNGEGNCQDTTFENSGNLVTDSSTMKMVSLHKTLLVNSRQVLAKEPREMFVDGRSKKMMALENKASHSTRAALDGERTVESIAAAASSSSVSSGNSAGERVSDERKHNTKRKFRNTEEFECQSDKLQKECAGMKKSSPAQGGRGSKRSRAAEVHNLSERRRRDRINEKMRALQQLIPNCNKADKASVLDEAIEYLKKLKHQVQMMSIGSGLCVPALMFPPGNRHMYDAYAPVPVPHLSYMGMRMGMGILSSGLENTSPVFPILPIPGHPTAGAHLVPLKGWHQTSAFKQE